MKLIRSIIIYVPLFGAGTMSPWNSTRRGWDLWELYGLEGLERLEIIIARTRLDCMKVDGPYEDWTDLNRSMASWSLAS